MAVDNYINGNLSDFKVFVKNSKKSDLLEAILIYENDDLRFMHGPVHDLIVRMQRILKEK